MNLKGRRYLEDLGLMYEDIPQGYCYEEARKDTLGRGRMWKEERERYGFDSRELWSLDVTIELFLYERLSMYRDLNIKYGLFKDDDIFIYNDKRYTHRDAIDEILDNIKMTILYWEDFRISKEKDLDGKIINALTMLALVFDKIDSNCLEIGKINASRNVDFENELRIYGFTQKDIWIFRRVFNRFLYQRLDLYNQITEDFIDKETEYSKCVYKGKEYTFQEYINTILEGLRIENELSFNKRNASELDLTKINDAYMIFPLSFKRLWW